MVRENDNSTRRIGRSRTDETEDATRAIDWQDTEALGGEPRAREPMETKVLGGPRPSFAWLVIMNGPHAGRIFTLNPKSTSIGRDASNDIILDDDGVSRRHAKVRVQKGKEGKEHFYIHDLATPNGTLVNDEKVLKKALADGDRIQIGETRFVFKKV